MRRRQFAPAMRGRSHRIRIGRFATALSALVALAAPVLTQAQNAPRVGWIFSDASALNPPKLARFQGGQALRSTYRRSFSCVAGAANTILFLAKVSRSAISGGDQEVECYRYRLFPDRAWARRRSKWCSRL